MMKIGELSKQTGLSIDAIRFYEKQKLIKSLGRTEGNYRSFDQSSVELLRFIAKCRALDISLADIKKLIQVRSGTARSCREADLVIDEQLHNLRDRIKELKRLETQLTELRSVCKRELAPDKCKIIRVLNGEFEKEKQP